MVTCVVFGWWRKWFCNLLVDLQSCCYGIPVVDNTVLSLQNDKELTVIMICNSGTLWHSELLQKNRHAMERPVCSLKQLTTTPTRFASCDGHEVLHWSRRASFRLLQVTLLYLAITWIAWAFPPLYDRWGQSLKSVIVWVWVITFIMLHIPN